MSDNSYPKALYRPHDAEGGFGEVHEVWGHKVHMLTVADKDEEAEAVKAGWNHAPPEDTRAPKPAAKPHKHAPAKAE